VERVLGQGAWGVPLTLVGQSVTTSLIRVGLFPNCAGRREGGIGLTLEARKGPPSH